MGAVHKYFYAKAFNKCNRIECFLPNTFVDMSPEIFHYSLHQKIFL